MIDQAKLQVETGVIEKGSWLLQVSFLEFRTSSIYNV